jgi:hypothetical protein
VIPDDQAGDDQADDAAEEQVGAGEGDAVDVVNLVIPSRWSAGDAPPGDDRQHAGCDQALVERAHDRVVGPSLTKNVPMIDVMIAAPPITSG